MAKFSIKHKVVPCSKCGNWRSIESEYCVGCRNKLRREATNKCLDCGKPIKRTAYRCGDCYKLSRKQPAKRESCPPHHWDLDVANFAVCKLCGVTKQFATPLQITEFLNITLSCGAKAKKAALVRVGLAEEEL